MLALDAIEGGCAPALWMVLTTRSTDPDPTSFYDSRRQLQRAIRRRLGDDVQFAWVIEFTTGYGPNAAGGRRPHWNCLMKGCGSDDQSRALVDDAIREVWCKREDAEPWAQFVGEVQEVGGLMRYLSLHFLKESQAPPAGWSGHRFTATRGYLWAPAPVARDAARRSLREKRELWRALNRGLTGEEAERAVSAALEIADATTWVLHKLAAPTVSALPAGERAGVGEKTVTSARHRGQSLGVEYEDDGSVLHHGEDLDAMLVRVSALVPAVAPAALPAASLPPAGRQRSAAGGASERQRAAPDVASTPSVCPGLT
jgi:hypothetical protein